MKKKLATLIGIVCASALTLCTPIIAECNHDWVVLSEDEATCYSEGYQDQKCSLCGDYREVTLQELDHDWTDYETIDEPTCFSYGTAEAECKICGMTDEIRLPISKKHSYESWYVEKPATTKSEGKKVRECEWCGKKQTKTIPKLVLSASQKAVQKSLDSFFSSAKSYNTGGIKKCFTNQKKVSLFVKNKKLASYVRSKNKKTTFNITKITVSGKSATAKVSCKYFDGKNLFNNAIDDAYLYILKNPRASTSATDNKLYQSVKKWDKYFKSTAKYTTKDITIKLSKIGSSWKISSFTNDLDNVLHCNYKQAYDEYFDGM